MLRYLILSLFMVSFAFGQSTVRYKTVRQDTTYWENSGRRYRSYVKGDELSLRIEYWKEGGNTNIFYRGAGRTHKANYLVPPVEDTVAVEASFTTHATLPDSALISAALSFNYNMPRDCPYPGCLACEALEEPLALRTISFLYKMRLPDEGSPWVAMGSYSFSNAGRTTDTALVGSAMNLTMPFSPQTALEIGIEAGKTYKIGVKASTFASCTQTTETDFSDFVLYSPNFFWFVPGEWIEVARFYVNPFNDIQGMFSITGGLSFGGDLSVSGGGYIAGDLVVGGRIRMEGGNPGLGKKMTSTDVGGNAIWASETGGGGSIDSSSSVPNPRYSISWLEEFFGNPVFVSSVTTLYKDWALHTSGAVSIGSGDSTGWGNMVGVASYSSNASNVYAKVYHSSGSVSRGTIRLGSHYTRFEARFRRFTNSASNDTLRFGLVSPEWLGTSLGGNASGRPRYGIFFEHYEDSGDSLMAVVRTPDTLVVINTGFATGTTTKTGWIENQDGTTLFYVNGVLVGLVAVNIPPVLLGPLFYYKAPAAQFGFHLDYIWVWQTGLDRRW